MPLLLGIETSCDECSASVVRAEPRGAGHTLGVLSVATFSQIRIHRPYGGVVPEIASRNHLETVQPMIEKALTDAAIAPTELDAVAVTNRPGLVGALLVGVSAAKALSYALRKPLVAVNHLEGHAVSPFLDRPEPTDRLDYPALIAVVSGGHTNLYVARSAPEGWPADFLASALVGRSRDDAAGEAFDKTAKLLGFPYPGGAALDRASEGGDPRAFEFPRALAQKDTLDFSFSGFKTAVALRAEELRRAGKLEERLADLCASIQEGIIDALLNKIGLAIRTHGCRSLALVGGVAANRRLRARLDSEWRELGLAAPPVFPLPRYCTDNAAMIAGAGAFRLLQGRALEPRAALLLNAIPNPS
jgi:N6-L-threonylcarbamoyladenine synthase